MGIYFTNIQMACASTADCMEVTDGCCLGVTILEFADDAIWGDFEGVWEQTDFVPVAGTTYNQCQSAAFSDAMMAWEGAEMTGVDGLQMWKDTMSEEEMEALGIFPEDTVEDMLSYGGSDMYSFESVIQTAACIDGDEAADFAATLMATGSAALAVALL